MEKKLSQLSLLCHYSSLLYIHLVSKNYWLMYPSLLSHLCPCCNLYHPHFLAGVLAVIFFTRFTISNPLLQRYQVILNMLIASLVAQVKAGDPGSNPGSGRSPGEGNGNPLQYSCLENPMEGGAWQDTVHGVAKSQTRPSDFTSLHFKHANQIMSIIFVKAFRFSNCAWVSQ